MREIFQTAFRGGNAHLLQRGFGQQAQLGKARMRVLMGSTAERVEAARAGASLAQERLDSEQKRFGVGLSTTFLVTQAQRDLLEAQVNLLQTSLDFESSLVNFEAVQQAPPLAAGTTLGVRGTSVVLVPTPAPRGVFRPGAGF